MVIEGKEAMSQTAVATRQQRNQRQRPRPVAAASLPDSGGAAVRRFAMDAVEWLLLFAFYVWFLTQLVSAFRSDPANWSCLVLIVSESVAVVFLLFRHGSRSISAAPGEWALAVAATLLPLLARPGGESLPALAQLGQGMLLIGTVLVLCAKIALGRRIGMIPAHRGLALGGAYRVVRHPIYACYIVCHLGVLLQFPTLRNVCVYAIFYGLQVPRLLIEEAHLRSDPQYGEYLGRVRYRLIPGVF